VRPARGGVPHPVGEDGLQLTKHPGLHLVVCCVLLCAFAGVAASFDDDGDPGVFLCPADDPLGAPDETVCAPSVVDGQRPVSGPAGGTVTAGPALLAAVPGGLCLLS
jgi:hypothetical protein